MTAKGMVYQDLSHDREVSPGPGAYHNVRSSLSRREITAFGREERRTGDWCLTGCDSHGSPSRLVRSSSANARMMSPGLERHRRSSGSRASPEPVNFEATPGPAAYNVDAYGRALTARSATIGRASRATEQWNVNDCAKNTPGPLSYDAGGAWRNAAVQGDGKARSACLTSPPRRSCLRRGDFIVHDLQDGSQSPPGPGAYASPPSRGSRRGRAPQQEATRRARSQQRVRFEGDGPRISWAFRNGCDEQPHSSPGARASDPARVSLAAKWEDTQAFHGDAAAAETSATGKPRAAAESLGQPPRRPSYLKPTISSSRKADIVAGIRNGLAVTAQQPLD